jgi:uncharacterized protein YkwD
LALVLAQAPAAAQADLATLRARALELVNASRQEHGLTPLTSSSLLNEVAQEHARDMQERNYYGHVSPEGHDVRDRYLAADGSRWKLVAENIARCQNCDPPLSVAEVERLHEGWMNSPGHRANILGHGLQEFGYGLVTSEERGLYAVQTFAGPGQPRGDRETAAPGEMVPPEHQTERALAFVNAARRSAGLKPLAPDAALAGAAQRLVPESGEIQATFAETGALVGALPESARADWRRLGALADACGGCGTDPTAADLRFFIDQWLGERSDALLDPAFTHMGLALEADGSGRKLAVAVLGEVR